ncbi:MAG: hypothetical protein MJE77_28535 [Proteobacteria bacterium]|nr:hypothetical protein [Pseudomonadota bacterium]
MLFIFALALLFFVSPLRALWARTSTPWWVLSALWIGVVAAGILVARSWMRDDR